MRVLDTVVGPSICNLTISVSDRHRESRVPLASAKATAPNYRQRSQLETKRGRRGMPGSDNEILRFSHAATMRLGWARETT